MSVNAQVFAATNWHARMHCVLISPSCSDLQRPLQADGSCCFRVDIRFCTVMGLSRRSLLAGTGGLAGLVALGRDASSKSQASAASLDVVVIGATCLV